MKYEVLAFSGVVLFIILLAFIIMGPKGCSAKLNSWKASSYGSDWLVVQYAQDGSIIKHWELKDKYVGNEKESDGIYFLDNKNNVVHLSGHYIYVQVNSESIEEIKQDLIGNRVQWKTFEP